MTFHNQEEKDKYFSWLKSLKVGDFVIINRSTWGKSIYSVGCINKITPKGWIVIGKIYFKDGESCGEISRRLEEYTEEKAKKFVLIPNATNYLNNIEWKQLQEKDPDMLLEIYEKVKGRLAKE